MIRRKDVAELAGTSPAVVSYVLNGSPQPVAPATRERVLRAVAELNYRPNRIARSLRMNKTMTFGFVSPNFSNPFFAELSNAIEDAAFEVNYTMLVGNSSESLSRQRAHLNTFVDHQVDGLLLVPAESTTSADLDLVPPATPLVLLDRLVPGATRPRIMVNNAEGAKSATEHLLEHGRRRIACIAGPVDSSPSAERVAGFRLAVANVAGSAGDATVRHVPFGRRAGYLAATELLLAGGLDAFFVTSDEQAVGVLRAIAEAGLNCPRDIALVSFDGITASEYTVPALTSMAQPFSDIGTTAISLLLKLIEDVTVGSELTELEVSLLRRGSCGCDDPAGGWSAERNATQSAVA